MTTQTETGWSIERTAEITGVSRHTLRYYERIGLLAPVPRDVNGHRRYTGADVGAVGFLTLLRDTGMPIQDMLEFVELTRAGDVTVPDRVRVLKAHRDSLVARLEDLHRHLGAITTKIDIYEALLAASTPESPGPSSTSTATKEQDR
ncbi:MerR family transcriptional regulator [Cellulomonas soli]|uniref:MerR family transcriptional regulator n=1 Tax=Cellulomonas soli TaxID=931535 RepID=UPI003F83857C